MRTALPHDVPPVLALVRRLLALRVGKALAPGSSLVHIDCEGRPLDTSGVTRNGPLGVGVEERPVITLADAGVDAVARSELSGFIARRRVGLPGSRFPQQAPAARVLPSAFQVL